ncbi:MAG: RNA pseudouridine synthase [Rhodospirillales bacterium 20-64-7]|nr:MAG: RNA pseudouridine synthase [Rhodospirillales bacterium 20-64-7]HQT75813.1 RluA family pseudouridine synthase [Rhodopila sp.]
MSIQARIVSEDEADIRLDRWFRRHFPGLQQSAIQKLCRTGQIRVDGHRADTATRLVPGQTIRIPPIQVQPEARPAGRMDPGEAKDLQSLVIYKDEHILAVNKPYGLPVQGGPGITRHLDGMLDALRFEAEHRPRLVHRLDRDTTGALLLARTPGSAAKLAALFRGRDIEKTYWAVVAGRPLPVEGRIDMPLKRIGGVRGERTAPADRDDPDGARAITDYRTLDNAAQKLAWLELKPLTGRTHQLRVHCVALRTPILGDEKYEEPDQNRAFAALIQGLPHELHLHARRLELPHPAGGTLMVEADLPPHMKETFRTLGFHAPPAQPPGRRR